MTLAVLDASALLALLLGEPGSEKVRAVLAASALTVVNLGEVVGHFARNGAAERDIRLVLDPLPIDIVVFDEELAFATGLLLFGARVAARGAGADGGSLLAEHRSDHRGRDRSDPMTPVSRLSSRNLG